MKISVVIPCHPNHIRLLPKAIDSCLNQSYKPHEIIVVGFCGKYKDSSNIKYLNFKKVQSSGKNRQLGSDACTGDIIVYQDADDRSHPKRLETISHCFSKYDIVHLNHSYISGITETPPEINFDNINVINSDEIRNAYFPNGKFEECLSHNGYGEYVSNWSVHGVPAIKRDILNIVKWHGNKELILKGHKNFPLMEDFEFNHEVLFKINKSIIIDAPLYFYNNL